ncbi:MAG: hypothetical protein WCI81_04610 [Chlorobiaceae bacterium]|jgi:hypothetical protein
MKNNKESIASEVEKTMRLADEMAPLEVNHLFRVRLMQRIEQESVGGMRRLDFRLAFIALLVIINLGSTVLSLQTNKQQATAISSDLSENQSFDYTNQEFAFYDQTNENQTP